MSRIVSKTITAENQFTDWIAPIESLIAGAPAGQLRLSITGNSTLIEISILL